MLTSRVLALRQSESRNFGFSCMCFYSEQWSSGVVCVAGVKVEGDWGGGGWGEQVAQMVK